MTAALLLDSLPSGNQGHQEAEATEGADNGGLAEDCKKRAGERGARGSLVSQVPELLREWRERWA